MAKNTGWGDFKPACALFSGLFFLLIPPLAEAGWINRETAMMGTRIAVSVVHPNEAEATGAVEEALAEIARIERLMSTYMDASEISELNRSAAIEPVVVSRELYSLIELSLKVSALSDGAFDISYDSVGQHYDFREKRRPDTETLERERGRIDYRRIRLDPTRCTIHFERSGMRINLGGIAKGYAVERAAAILVRAGIRSAMLTAGGDTRLVGDRDGQPWIVGIQNPRDENAVAVRVPLENEAISTSGDYERFFELDGQRFHHIVTPATGVPAEGVRSASVIGADATWTDALSTTVFVLGVEAGLAMIEKLPGYEAIVIDASQRLHFSKGLLDPANP